MAFPMITILTPVFLVWSIFWGYENFIKYGSFNTLLYRDYKKLARNIDKELFQQFSINQTTKILLAETDIEKLYSLCIDVVRELTSSSVTALILYDSIRNKFIVKGYSDIINFRIIIMNMSFYQTGWYSKTV